MIDTTLTGRPAARERASRDLVRRARSIELMHGAKREALGEIRDLMIAFLSEHKELFDPRDFELPVAHGRFFKLVEGGETPYGLYLSVTLPGKEAAPHIHGLWCVTVGIAGREVNHYWRRTDDAGTPGKAALSYLHGIDVVPGSGMTLGADEIHSTETLGDEPSWMLHLYQRPFAEFPSLLFFQPARGTVRRLPAHAAKTIRG